MPSNGWILASALLYVAVVVLALWKKREPPNDDDWTFP
jgi:hypothetical protein